jgi:hypothetical protein
MRLFNKTISELKFVALVVSGATNPFTLLIISLLLGNISLIRGKFSQTLIFFIIGFSLPIIFYFQQIFRHKKHILHFVALSQSSRTPVFLAAIFSSMANVWLFSSTNQENTWIMNAMLLTILFAVFYLVNKYIDKASLHTGAFSFTMIYLADRAGIIFAIFLAALPLICWARIKLHKHTWFQLLLGSALGMFIGLLSWTF